MAAQEKFLGLSLTEISILEGIVSYANQRIERLRRSSESEKFYQLIHQYEQIKGLALALLKGFPKVRTVVTDE